MTRVSVFVAVACACALGCSLLVSTNGLVGTPDSGAAIGTDGSSDGASIAIDGATNVVDGADAAQACGGLSGMIDTGSFCIDALEVTNADYTAFVTAKGNDHTGQPVFCGWNTDFTLACTPLSTDPTAAVTCVDWCDAYAYCTYVGKRLCGKIGGGTVATKAELTQADADQWYRACSKAGAQRFPYGAAYQPGVCNDMTRGLGKPTTVGSLPGCVGGYPGIFDLSGNATEWEDACASQSGAADKCTIRGGAWDDTAATTTNFLACDAANSTEARSYADDTLGFRCCSP